MIIEVIGNILNAKQDAIAHCVTADYSLGAGIALALDEKYDIRNELSEIGDSIYPDCIKVVRGNKTIYNLVNKHNRYAHATLDDLKECLIKLRDQLIDDGITNIAMPRIASGKDRLNWSDVKDLIYEIFDENDENLYIFIYSIE